jgi:AcrR family transcriptional regulator
MTKSERIIKAARERFRYYGLSKTTMQEIASDAGVAVGTLYLYFKNKDELVAACAEEFVALHRKEAAAILASDAPADEKLRRYVLNRFRRSAETRTGSRHLAELTRAVLRVKPDRVVEEGQMMWEVVVQILREGVEAGVFQISDPEDDAQVFLFSIAYFFPNALSHQPIPARKEDLVRVTEWFLKAWRSGSGTTDAPRPAKSHGRRSRHASAPVE